MSCKSVRLRYVYRNIFLQIEFPQLFLCDKTNLPDIRFRDAHQNSLGELPFIAGEGLEEIFYRRINEFDAGRALQQTFGKFHHTAYDEGGRDIAHDKCDCYKYDEPQSRDAFRQTGRVGPKQFRRDAVYQVRQNTIDQEKCRIQYPDRNGNWSEDEHPLQEKPEQGFGDLTNSHEKRVLSVKLVFLHGTRPSRYCSPPSILLFDRFRRQNSPFAEEKAG